MADPDATSQDLVQQAQSEIGRLQTHAVSCDGHPQDVPQCSRDLS